MVEYNKLLHYDCLAEFNSQYYKSLLTFEHLNPKQIRINKLAYVDGDEADANFWGYELEKDGKKYLLSCDFNGEEINPRDLLPIKANGLIKVASKGVVYWIIENPISMKFKAKKTMSFKQFVKAMTPFNHSNVTHYQLNYLLSFTQMCSRMYSRVSSPAGFGKDSAVDLFGLLVGGSGTVENPTIAKLEERANCLKWLAVNEVCEITPANWREIEQILLSMGAFKPVVTKRSKAHGKVGETIDISKLSMSLFYNDIDHYNNVDKYFDNISKGAVKNRFPAFRFNGVLQEDFNKVKQLNIHKYVSQNIALYVELINNFEYYKKMLLESNNTQLEFDYPDYLPSRWVTNLGVLARTLNMFCDSKEEFNLYMQVVLNCLTDYKEMLKTPHLIDTIHEKLDKLVINPTVLYNKKEEIRKNLKGMSTFVDKNKYLRQYKVSKTEPIKDVTMERFW